MGQSILLALSVSIDAFSASMAQAAVKQKNFIKSAVITSFSFGFFQSLMPLIGWLLGKQFRFFIMNIDHWVAFFLLSLVGAEMIFKGLKKRNEKPEKNLNYRNILMLSIATSIDALVIGATFAFIKIPVIITIILFGVITFIACLIGWTLGNKLQNVIGRKMEIVGGIILILIGIKILIEHLFL